MLNPTVPVELQCHPDVRCHVLRKFIPDPNNQLSPQNWKSLSSLWRSQGIRLSGIPLISDVSSSAKESNKNSITTLLLISFCIRSDLIKISLNNGFVTNMRPPSERQKLPPNCVAIRFLSQNELKTVYLSHFTTSRLVFSVVERNVSLP